MEKLSMIFLLITILFAVGIATVTFGFSNFKIINSTGIICEGGISTDKSFIDWGIVNINCSYIRHVNITNYNGFPVTLNLTTTAPNYFGVSWDSEGTSLAINDTKQATIQLHVLASAIDYIGHFNFSIIISGSPS